MAETSEPAKEPAAAPGGAKAEAPTEGAAAARPARTKSKRKVHSTQGIAHIFATFNNTIVTITDRRGNATAWSTAGSSGFHGSRKSTPYAAQMAAAAAAK